MPLLRRNRTAPRSLTLDERLEAAKSHKADGEDLAAAATQTLLDAGRNLEGVANDANEEAARLARIANEARSHATAAANTSTSIDKLLS